MQRHHLGKLEVIRMKGINRNLGNGLTIAVTLGIGILAQAQPASAQLLEIATGALSALTGNSAQSQVIQQPLAPTERNLSVGTNNLNGNNFNFCVTGCLPNTATATPQLLPRPVFPPSSMPVSVPQQSSIASSSVYTGSSTVPQGLPLQTGVPMSGVIPQGIPQTFAPRPPARPVLSIPPIQLPINF
jgi:hypothetical protein